MFDVTRQSADLKKDRSVPAWLTLGAVVVVLAAVAAFLVAVAPALPRTDNLSLVYDEQLKPSLVRGSDHPAAALPPLSGEVNGHNVTVLDCPGFLALARHEALRSDWAAVPGAQAYAECVPQHVLSVFGQPRAYLAPQAGLARLVADRFDPASLNDRIVGFVSGAGLTGLKAGAGQVAGPYAVTVSADGATWRFDIVASIDVRNMGLEELVLRVTLQDPAGDRVGYAVIGQDEDGSLRALPVDQMLMPQSQDFIAAGELN